MSVLKDLILAGGKASRASFHKGGLIAAKGCIGAEAGMVDFENPPLRFVALRADDPPFLPRMKTSSERV